MKTFLLIILALTSACSTTKNLKATPATASGYIPDNTGQYMSPYTHDGVLADWVDKAASAKAGAQLGKAALGTTGGVLGEKYGGWLGGAIARTVGQKVGELTARSITIKAIGGWEYIRQTSDMSFGSLRKMADFLRRNYRAHPHFAAAIDLTGEIYPEFKHDYAQWVKEAAR